MIAWSCATDTSSIVTTWPWSLPDDCCCWAAAAASCMDLRAAESMEPSVGACVTPSRGAVYPTGGSKDCSLKGIVMRSCACAGQNQRAAEHCKALSAGTIPQYTGVCIGGWRPQTSWLKLHFHFMQVKGMAPCKSHTPAGRSCCQP